MKYKTLFLLIFFFTLVSNSDAQELITDRPDFTESAVVVAAGTIQIESGFEYDSFENFSELTYPNLLARIGLGKQVELRLGFPGWIGIEVDDFSKTYLNDLLLEAKYQITGEQAEMPFAILLVSTLPTGDEEISVGSAEFGLKLATGYDINNRISLGVNIGAISVDTGNERELISLASVSMGIGLNERTGAFVEAFANIPPNDVWQPVLDGGFTYLLSADTQLDIYAGTGLNDYTPDFIIGGGFSIRFGN